MTGQPARTSTNRLVVSDDDLIPLLFVATGVEVRETVEWLKEHGVDGLPAMLARCRVSLEYRLAWDNRHFSSTFLSPSWTRYTTSWSVSAVKPTLFGRIKRALRL